jgi:mRNA interferase RelE/StbE
VKTYVVSYTTKAAKQFKKLNRNTKIFIAAAIMKLEREPRPAGAKKMSDFDNYWRIRIRDYRVIYSIYDRELVIDVIKIGHRREIYR